MYSSWNELPEYAKALVMKRRFKNEHARGVYYHLKTIPEQDAYQAWIEDVADAYGNGDMKKVAALFAERYPHSDSDAWDVGTDDDTSEEEDEETRH